MASGNHNSTINKVGRGKLGFIGLGYMGSRIAKRLLGAGYPLIVFNRNRDKAAALGFSGAEIAASPGELAFQYRHHSFLPGGRPSSSRRLSSAGRSVGLCRTRSSRP